MKKQEKYKLLNKSIVKRVHNSRTILYRYYDTHTGELRFMIVHRFLIPSSEFDIHSKYGFELVYNKCNCYVLQKITVVSEETMQALNDLYQRSINDFTSYKVTINEKAFDKLKEARKELYNKHQSERNEEDKRTNTI